MDGTPAAVDCTTISLALLSWIGHGILFGTALAALTWLAARLLKLRRFPAIEAALWSVVLIKFLAPVGPGWSCSLASAVQQFGSAARSWRAATAPLDEMWHVAPAPAPTLDPLASNDPGLPNRTDPALSGSQSPVAGSASELNAAPMPAPLWPLLAASLYLCAVGGMFTARIRADRGLRRRCRALPIADEATLALVANVGQRFGLRRAPDLRITDEYPCPFVIGLFRPMLILPRTQLARPSELETVAAHEIAHLRRGDLLVRRLQWIVGTTLFFWPVVAWVNRRIDLARECACDEWALRHGRLTAGEYARCLLYAAQRVWLAHRDGHQRGWALAQPAGMAMNRSTIERRIEMILSASPRRVRRPASRWLLAALLLAWAGFSLAGSVQANQSPSIEAQDWPATEDAVKQRTAELFDIVVQRKAADVNGDGIVYYLEKDAYLVGLAMKASSAFMTRFPYADRNHSGALDILEAYDALRGITLVAYADRRPSAATGAKLDLEFYHEALDAQQWLLENVNAEPAAADLDNIWSVLKRIRGSSKQDHIRKLDHGGGPEQHLARRLRLPDSRFPELEGQIAALEAELAATTDSDEIRRLEGMLATLETLLSRLRNS